MFTVSRLVRINQVLRCKVIRETGHLRMAVMHLPIKFGVDICIQSRVIDISLKFKMAAAAILDFQFI